ncbi:retrovirus-related pol polyprotein from transposon TNT 1-94 [Tanacetum coccineum]
MRMEQYLTNTDSGLWQVIMNGDEPVQTTKDENGVETEVPPKIAQALLQRQKERKAKSILLLAIPDEYQLRFHTIKDAKSLWAAIKSRFGGNVESKKMQKNVLKQQFENFSRFDTEGLDKAYDRFQKLISQLEIHGATVSNKDANPKFLRALPSSWNNIALIMRNKEGIDEIDIDDLYNNLKVFEADIKGSSESSSNSQNVAFLSAEDTNSINEVNTANGVSTTVGHSSQGQASSSSFLISQVVHNLMMKTVRIMKKTRSPRVLKGNGLLILQSIDQGPFELGTTRNTLRTTPEGGVLLRPKRPRTCGDLSVHATNIVLPGLPKDIYMLINHNIEAKSIWDNVKMLLAGSELTKEDRESQLYDEFERFKMLLGENINEYYVQFHKLVNDMRNIGMTMPNIQLNSKGNGAASNGGVQNRAGNANVGQGKPVKCYNCNGIGHIARNCTQPKRPQNSDYFKDKMLLMQAQENGAVLDEEELLFLAGEQANTFDADVDNQPVQDLALNEDNIFQADECDAFDSDVDDEPTAQSIFMAKICPQPGQQIHKLDHLMHQSYLSNVIPYEQYLLVDNISVVPSCASSTLNDVCVSSDNDAFVPHDPIVTELKICTEQVIIYEQRAKFELTEREQRMDDQMHMLI